MTIPYVAQGKLDRRRFLQGAGVSLGAGLLAGSSATSAVAQAVSPESITHASVSPPMSEKEKLVRIASNSYPIRYIFKSKEPILSTEDQDVAMKKKYGEITMLDFPEFTKKTFPGVYQMDLWSSLFGDTDDASQFVDATYLGSDEKHMRPGSLTLRARPEKSGWRRWPTCW